MTKSVFLILITALTGCAHIHQSRTNTPARDEATQLAVAADRIANLQADINEAAAIARQIEVKRLDIPEMGAGPGDYPIEGPFQFKHKGERRKLFRQTVLMVCPVIQMANQLKIFSDALSLFDEAETRKIDNYLNFIGGLASIAGGTMLAFGNSNEMRTAGGITLGLGGLGVLLQSLPFAENKVLNEALVRVEFNRQFAVLVRQYIPSTDEASRDCLSLVQTAEQYGLSPSIDEIDEKSIGLLKASYQRIGIIQEGVVKVGTSASSIRDALVQKGFKADESTRLTTALGRLADATEPVRATWAVQRTELEDYIAKVLYGVPFSAP
jgi:hypothetical protein